MSIPKPKGKYMSQSEVIGALAILTEADKKDVKVILASIKDLIAAQLNSKSKAFAMHGVAKLVIKRKKARKAGMGRNPFTGLSIQIKAKPACNVAKGRALKALKDAVA